MRYSAIRPAILATQRSKSDHLPSFIFDFDEYCDREVTGKDFLHIWLFTGSITRRVLRHRSYVEPFAVLVDSLVEPLSKVLRRHFFAGHAY